MEDRELMEEYVRERKREKGDRRKEMVNRVLGSVASGVAKLAPKGINPRGTNIRNKSMYIPSGEVKNVPLVPKMSKDRLFGNLRKHRLF